MPSRCQFIACYLREGMNRWFFVNATSRNLAAVPTSHLVPNLAVALSLSLLLVPRLAGDSKRAPQLISLFPVGLKQGSVAQMDVRGRHLDGAYAVWSETPGLKGRVRSIEPMQIEEEEKDEKKVSEGHRAVIEIEVPPDAKAGMHTLRLIAPSGVSNGLKVLVNPDAARIEADGSHAKPELAQALSVPDLVVGRLASKGEVDFYAFSVEAGEEVSFSCVSNTLDRFKYDAVQFSIHEVVGSWFDPNRTTPLAVTEEKPRLTHRFEKAGRYLLQVSGFSGIGGPDFSYQLRVGKALPSSEQVRLAGPSQLDELQDPFRRNLDERRVSQLLERTVAAEVRMSPAQGNDLPMLIEGAIDTPGKIATYPLKVQAGQSLAIELQLPAAMPTDFNPHLSVVKQDATEIFTNYFRKIAGDGDDWVKLVQSKTLFAFEQEGEYTLKVRDITERYGDPMFQYRILIRPQVPHVGRIDIAEDAVNLGGSEGRALNIRIDYEEGFDGDVAIGVDSLPPGVRALPAAPEADPALVGPEEHRERFLPKTKRTRIVLVAGAGASPTQLPHLVRITACPIIKGKVGSPWLVREVPVMVTGAPGGGLNPVDSVALSTGK